MARFIDQLLDLLHRTRLLVRLGLVLGGLALFGGCVASLWPTAGTRLNQVGYASVCPFAPFSSVILLVMAAGCFAGLWVVRALLRWRERRASARGPQQA